ncbi:TetR/AcrR family transcriptional regulator [Nocardia puris]|uniref:TetR family transcriptional regulator n=1 Tax=Nocardia puris TaxID=208602 RepID=A0A366DVG7_9NOCA|nr:TetR/AcrR family transcriptional regulator [Nocardia puris]MBF6210488.1 TetR/AcrR family transcriptional regulator [Nocardia puris]MBF6367563.1 TetR/AcrR family transcriptional regulator [Nocardia puris]MBF6457748.1 TetR/AcrR family transcriptional regulator [Nocardia puris]RBO93915.1 TetR family transcriptional regulator [Nocardia puris]
MSGWLADERSTLAAQRILDAAAELFAQQGVAETQMADIAEAAGCSRATLYRYFENRQAVRLAFVHREARRLGAAVAAEVGGIADPGERVVAAVLAAVRAVRADPLLIAWFRPADAGVAVEIGQSSAVIEGLTAAFLPEELGTREDRTRWARWLTRLIVSLLTVPGVDDSDERAMLEQFLAPLFVSR